jgi:regulatory protein
MSRITQLKAQKNRKWVNIFLDGTYFTSLELITVAKQGLKVGMDISQSEFNQLLRKHDDEKLLFRAMNFLSLRPRSKQEVTSYLQKKWTPKLSKEDYRKRVRGVVEKLKKENVLNDSEFANWWVEQRLTFRPKGKIALRRELQQKGIGNDIISEVLASLDEVEAAKRVVEKKSRMFKGQSSMQARRKLIALLQRRGFSWDTIRQIVDESL